VVFMFKVRLLFSICIFTLSTICAQIEPSFRIEEVKEKIIESLSPNLVGASQSRPLLILIGGYVSSGKTTLARWIQERYGMTNFSLNSIRQAMLNEGIDIRVNKQEERKILFDVYPRLLAPCIANLQNIVIDANANRQGIQDALRFLAENSGGAYYRVVKIHLTAPAEELHKRVRARIQQVGLHQGTETDLDYELQTASKAIHPEDYDLVIDTKNSGIEDEMQIVQNFLQPYFE